MTAGPLRPRELRPATRGERRARVALVAVGLGLALVGAVAAVTTLPPAQWVRVALWLAAGVVVHDAVVAPLALALGVGVLGRVRRPAVRRLLRAGLLLAATVVVVAVPLLATGGLR
ncbi:hypothetical protein [Lapillicoccus jejuensis]|uniref:Uncharacterized protein n=1 Tax=Lapillicoccus jejuensis TaxID=402171 RepID=A0A542E2C7_9MICO|nr:hypothetical protein [Lapillicoccus jejuensis]TQJ09490.1 hypothetical protein FB458_2602 [Lapillicoccus jejuensis]